VVNRVCSNDVPFTNHGHPQSIPPTLAPPCDPIEDVLDDEEEFDTDPVLSAFEIIKRLADLDDGTDGFGQPKPWRGDMSDSLIHAVAKDLMKPGVLDELRRLGFASDAKVIEYLLGDGADSDASHGFLMAPPDVVAAAMRAAVASETEPIKMASIGEEQSGEATVKEKQEQPIDADDEKPAPLVKAGESKAATYHSPDTEKVDETLSFTSSSSSTSSWSCWGTQDEKRDSIVSTMTTTERRTLPDGTVETKRVLKKRFADGREESNESVERQTSPYSNPRSTVSKPLESEIPTAARQDKQTQTDVKENPLPRRSGWFWRE
jgi:hypothetical protein